MHTYCTDIAVNAIELATPKDVLAFRLELVHCLLDKVGLRRGVTVSSEGVDTASSERVCYLERVSDIPGMKRVGAVSVYYPRQRSRDTHPSVVECVE